MNEKKFFKEKSNQIRKKVVDISVKNKAGHIAPSLSCSDILVALYYGVMSYNSKDPLWEDRDRLIFSKSHGCYALYAVLADKGILPKDEWDNFYTDKSSLQGCMEKRTEYGLEAGCGSLGHGLPIATGIAFGASLQGKTYQTFCVVGDGEMQEGSSWEAIQFGVKHELNNLTIIIDRNRLQAMDFVVNVLDKGKDALLNRLKGFGLSPLVCDGHDVEQLIDFIRKVKKLNKTTPQVIIADTVKGFSLKCMENIPKFHFRIPTEEELDMEKFCDYGK